MGPAHSTSPSLLPVSTCLLLYILSYRNSIQLVSRWFSMFFLYFSCNFDVSVGGSEHSVYLLRNFHQKSSDTFRIDIFLILGSFSLCSVSGEQKGILESCQTVSWKNWVLVSSCLTRESYLTFVVLKMMGLVKFRVPSKSNCLWFFVLNSLFIKFLLEIFIEPITRSLY